MGDDTSNTTTATGTLKASAEVTTRSAALESGIGAAGMVRLNTWWDPDLAFNGFDARSEYTERYWLPVLGPSALLALRWSSEMLAAHPDGVSVRISELARFLGLGGRGGSAGPAPRALQRLAYFGLARERAGTLMIRTHVPPLPPLFARRLPKSLQDSHPSWLLRAGASEKSRSANGGRARLPATGT